MHNTKKSIQQKHILIETDIQQRRNNYFLTSIIAENT